MPRFITEESAEIRALGGFTVNGLGFINAVGLKSRLLLGVLASSRNPISRIRLAALLWPDASTSSARHSLSQALYIIRRSGAAEILRVERATVSFSDRVAVDAHRFLEAVEWGEHARAAQLYGGPFASGVVALDDGFEDWLQATRLRFHEVARRLAFRLSDEFLPTDCLRITESLLAFDPLDAEIRNLRIQLLASLGEPEAAQALFEESVEIWQSQFAENWAYQQPSTQPPRPLRSQGDSRTFVGRRREFSLLQDAWSRVHSGTTQKLLLCGEAGIGKTVLSERFRRWLTLQGGSTAWATGFSSQRNVPFGVAAQWLSDLGVTAVLGTNGVPSSVAKLPPEYGEAVLGRQRILKALAEKLLKNSPICICIDDLQWADDASLGLLRYISQSFDDSRVLILGILRTDRSHWELTDSYRDFDRIDVEPLSLQDVTDFCKAAFPTDKAEISDVAHILHCRTGGNPLYLTALLTEANVKGLGRGRIPQSLRQFLEPRLGMLSPGAKITLAALGVTGETSLKILREVARPDFFGLELALAELSSANFVHADSKTVTARHGVLAEVALEVVGPAVERQLRGRAARALQKEPLSSPATVALHFDLAGQQERAYEAALRAATASAELFAHHETEHFLKIALTNAPDGDTAADIRRRLADIYLSQFRYDAATSVLDFKDVGILTPAPAAQLRAHQLLVQLLSIQEPGLVRDFAKLLEELRPFLHLDLHARLAVAYAFAVHSLREVPLVRAAIDRGLALIEALPAGQLKLRTEIRLTFLVALYQSASDALSRLRSLQASVREFPDANALWHAARGSVRIALGLTVGAEDDLLYAIELLEQTGGHDPLYMVMNNLGVLYQEQGRFEEAERLLEQAAGQRRDEELAPWAQVALENKTILAFERGDYRLVLCLADESLTTWARKSPHSWVSHTSIKGLALLELGDRQRAHECRRDIEVAGGNKYYASNDISYVEIFLARMAALAGKTEEAVGRLKGAAEHCWERNFFCAARMTLERLRLLVSLDPTSVYKEAFNLRPALTAAKARPLVERVDAILTRARLQGR